jgi:hypothetical protein
MIVRQHISNIPRAPANSPTRYASARRGQSKLRQCLQGVLGWLLDPETWFRAAAIAAARERDSSGTLQPLDIPVSTGSRKGHARCQIDEPGNGVQHDEQRKFAAPTSSSGSASALVGISDRALPSRELSEGAVQALGTGLGRPNPCARPPVAQAETPLRLSVTRRRASTFKRVQRRGYLRLANWILRTAHQLAALGLLGPNAGRIAFGWSAYLSKKSLAIWRSERTAGRDNSNRRAARATHVKNNDGFRGD